MNLKRKKASMPQMSRDIKRQREKVFRDFTAFWVRKNTFLVLAVPAQESHLLFKHYTFDLDFHRWRLTSPLFFFLIFHLFIWSIVLIFINPHGFISGFIKFFQSIIKFIRTTMKKREVAASNDTLLLTLLSYLCSVWFCGFVCFYHIWSEI